jgi:hypothetical protein
VNWTPPTAGPRTFFVQAMDVAGNRSAIRTDYQFTVQGAPRRRPLAAHRD